MSNSPTEERITAQDSKGFCHEARIIHSPHWGFSTAYDCRTERIIGQCELGGRLYEPMGDDDKEWEAYQERFAEWTDEIKVNLIPKCKQYFDTQ